MLNLLSIFLNSGDGSGNGGDWTTWLILGVVVVLIVGMLVFNMLTKNKRQKEADDGKKFLRPGDKIKTVGGIVGTIIQVNSVSETEKELVIETGINDVKTTMTIDINALYIIMQRGPESLAAIEKARQEREAAEAARLAEKQSQKSGGYNKSANSSAGANPKADTQVFAETAPKQAPAAAESAEIAEESEEISDDSTKAE